MRKMTFALLVVAVFLFGAAGSAFAVVDAFEVYMTDANGNFTEKTTSFGWNETPWLYVHAPQSFSHVSASWWESPSNEYFFSATGPGSAKDVWISLNQGQDALGNNVTWADVQESGLWSVNAVAYYTTGGIENDSTSFTVTPEPVSAALFLIGGISLAAARRRKQKLVA